MARTAYYWDQSSLRHDTGSGHVECAARVDCLRPEILLKHLPDLLCREPLDRDALEWIASLHERSYIQRIMSICEAGGGLLDDGDTLTCGESFDAALVAVNAALSAADAVMTAEVDNAFSAMRPPGHHALPDQAMGFCLFNNIAILARYLRQKHGIGRVAIVDFDVHHGNGTQDIFWADPDILFISLHQMPLWPGSGRATERGTGAGHGATLNFPMVPFTPEDEYLAEFQEKVLPALKEFQPEFLLVSAGFDAHNDDPLAQLRLTDEAYFEMGRALKFSAGHLCSGRLIALLEGGYDLAALQRSVIRFLDALLHA